MAMPSELLKKLNSIAGRDSYEILQNHIAQLKESAAGQYMIASFNTVREKINAGATFMAGKFKIFGGRKGALLALMSGTFLIGIYFITPVAVWAGLALTVKIPLSVAIGAINLSFTVIGAILSSTLAIALNVFRLSFWIGLGFLSFSALVALDLLTDNSHEETPTQKTILSNFKTLFSDIWYGFSYIALSVVKKMLLIFKSDLEAVNPLQSEESSAVTTLDKPLTAILSDKLSSLIQTTIVPNMSKALCALLLPNAVNSDDSSLKIADEKTVQSFPNLVNKLMSIGNGLKLSTLSDEQVRVLWDSKQKDENTYFLDIVVDRIQGMKKRFSTLNVEELKKVSGVLYYRTHFYLSGVFYAMQWTVLQTQNLINNSHNRDIVDQVKQIPILGKSVQSVAAFVIKFVPPHSPFAQQIEMSAITNFSVKVEPSSIDGESPSNNPLQNDTVDRVGNNDSKAPVGEENIMATIVTEVSSNNKSTLNPINNDQGSDASKQQQEISTQTGRALTFSDTMCNVLFPCEKNGMFI